MTCTKKFPQSTQAAL